MKAVNEYRTRFDANYRRGFDANIPLRRQGFLL